MLKAVGFSGSVEEKSKPCLKVAGFRLFFHFAFAFPDKGEDCVELLPEQAGW